MTREMILAELINRRTYIWDGDPTDWELADMAACMEDDGVASDVQIDAWLAELDQSCY